MAIDTTPVSLPPVESVTAGWWKTIFDNPKTALRYLLVTLALLGYDQAVPAGRVSELKGKYDAAARQADEQMRRIDELEKLLREVRGDQIQTLKAKTIPCDCKAK